MDLLILIYTRKQSTPHTRGLVIDIFNNHLVIKKISSAIGKQHETIQL